MFDPVFRRLGILASSVFLLVFGVAGISSAQVTLGQVDDFQDGSLMDWTGGAMPTNIATGGPGGAGDRFLQITSNGSPGAGGHLATFNSIQWHGDFLAAGVNVVEVWLRNQGADTLEIRAVLFGPFPLLTTRWTSTDAVVLPPDNVWRRVSFILDEAHMTQVLGSATFPSVIGGVSQLMFRNDPGAPSANGTATVSQMGIDGITASDAVTVNPGAFTVFPGFLSGGGLPDLYYSDNSYLRAHTPLFGGSLGDIVGLTLEGTSPTATPSRIRFAFETRVTSSGLREEVSLWDWDAGAWVSVFTRSAPTSDSAMMVDAPGPLARFVQAGTRKLRAKIGWKFGIFGFSGSWESWTDQTIWKIGP